VASGSDVWYNKLEMFRTIDVKQCTRVPLEQFIKGYERIYTLDSFLGFFRTSLQYEPLTMDVLVDGKRVFLLTEKYCFKVCTRTVHKRAPGTEISSDNIRILGALPLLSETDYMTLHLLCIFLEQCAS